MIKIAKGARDVFGEEIEVRNWLINNMRKCFESRCAKEIDTPVFEKKDLLTSKFIEEDDKLIYDLKDQGGELLSLRYDLTVPLARFIGLNSIASFKRYQFGKVYRRDQPQMTKGRFREFMQADFDIIGSLDPLYAEFELLQLITDIFLKLGIRDFKIRINDKQVVDSMLLQIGVSKDNMQSVCSSIDKLDKLQWIDVEKELIMSKGISKEVCDKLNKFINIKGPLSDTIKNVENFSDVSRIKLLERLLYVNNISQYFEYDIALVRGLDYYTGIMFEIVIPDSNVGSVGGGGRYDKLVYQVCKKNVDCVGFSIGIDRLTTYLLGKNILKIKQEDKIFVSCIDVDFINVIQLCCRLWESNLKASYLFKPNNNLVKQMQYATKNTFTYMIIIGTQEMEKNLYKVKNLVTGKELDVPFDTIVDYFSKIIQS